jgi:hypothetical protein
VLKRHFGLFAVVGAVAFVLAATWLIPANKPGDESTELAAAPATPGLDRNALSAAFDPELQKIGQISPREFAKRYPTPNYLQHLSWDPATAKFFDKVNAKSVTKVISGQKRELPGYQLNDEELARFKQNGFVVTERHAGFAFGQMYYDIYTRDLPVFITSDSVLHAWHRSYDAMLEELELTYLMHSLDALLAGMHESIPKASAEYGDGILKDSVLDADYFLAVARSLLKNPGVPTKLNQEERLKKTLDAIHRLGMEEFVLFGRRRDMDFSQFKPRGHYEANPELRKYFQAMMWCGRTDLRIAGGTGKLSSTRELGAAIVLLDLLRKAGLEDTWRKFDRVTQTFVGRTDSATFDGLARVAAAAKIKGPADLRSEEDLKKLSDAILTSDAGAQAIRSDIYDSPDSAAKVQVPRSFTVLGQKFVVDSWVTGKVVFDDIIWNGEKVIRRVPSGLDVAFAALGNNHVVPDLVERIENGSHRFRDRKPYQHNLAAVRNVIDGANPKIWDETIYTSWLKSLRTLTQPSDAPLPEAMRTREWAMKQTNTQMASWAQLRHDTILYVKQSYTMRALCYYPAGFVEPVVPFWAQMAAMARRSADLLDQTPFPATVHVTKARQVNYFRNFAAQMERLKAVAEKQLRQKELTADERKVLEDVMQIGHQSDGGSGTRPKYTGWYPALFYRGPEDCMKWDALVADVHTDVPSLVVHGDPGCVLHQGVGGVDLMVIAIDNGKDRVAYVGPTLSHFEFEMPGVARKTDAEWKADLIGGRCPPRPEWTRGYLVPHTDVKSDEHWTKRHRLQLD